MVKLEQPRLCWGVSLECIQAWSDFFLANWDVPGSPSALLLIQNEQSSWIHEPPQLGPYLEVTVFTSAQASLTYSCVWNSLCQKSLFVCKRVSELGSHNLQNNVFHLFNYCTDLLCMCVGGVSLMGVEVANAAFSELPDFSRHGKLLVLICSNHRTTLILKGTWMPDLLVNKSGRRKRNPWETDADEIVQKNVYLALKSRQCNKAVTWMNMKLLISFLVTILAPITFFTFLLYSFCHCFLIPCSQDSWFTGSC